MLSTLYIVVCVCSPQAPVLPLPPTRFPFGNHINELIYKTETDLQTLKTETIFLEHQSLPCSKPFPGFVHTLPGVLCPLAMSSPSWALIRLTSTHPLRLWKHFFALHSAARLYQIAPLSHSPFHVCTVALTALIVTVPASLTGLRTSWEQRYILSQSPSRTPSPY